MIVTVKVRVLTFPRLATDDGNSVTSEHEDRGSTYLAICMLVMTTTPVSRFIIHTWESSDYLWTFYMKITAPKTFTSVFLRELVNIL